MKLKCYPVCKCGYVFKKLDVYERLIEISPNHSRLIKICEPSCCPECREKIESVIFPKENYFGGIKFNYDKDYEN